MEQVKIDSKFDDKYKGILVIGINGSIDQSNCNQLLDVFNHIIQSGCYKVIVDFGELYYISSAGWGVFVGEIKRFRDKGGDIKLANMNADVYDVFQMLEFYHIIEEYATVSEAADSFSEDESELKLTINIESIGNIEPEVEPEKALNTSHNSNEETINLKHDIIEFIPDKSERDIFSKRQTNIVEHKFEKTINLKQIPLRQKVRYIIAQNPLLSIWGIKKILRSNHFGDTRINILKLWRLLKDLDLNTQKKRYRYYRSC